VVWEHGYLKTDTSIYYNITLYLFANIGRVGNVPEEMLQNSHKKEYSYLGSRSICYTIYKNDFNKYIENKNDININLFSELDI